MSELADQPFQPARGGTAPLAGAELDALLARLGGDWAVVDGHHLSKTYRFPDFASALAFVNRVGALADELNHHPDVHLGWGKARLDIWTHTVDGLAEGDFVLAAKADRAYGGA